MDSWTDSDPVDNFPRGSGNDFPEVAEMDLTTQTHHSDIAVASVGGSVQDAREDDWSPSDGLAERRRLIAATRAAITEGRARFEATHDTDDQGDDQ